MSPCDTERQPYVHRGLHLTRYVGNFKHFKTSVYYILTFEILAVKCHHSVEVNWSRYRDTGVTDPALAFS